MQKKKTHVPPVFCKKEKKTENEHKDVYKSLFHYPYDLITSIKPIFCLCQSEKRKFVKCFNTF